MEKDHTHNKGENYDLMTSSDTSSIDNLLLKNYKQTVHDLQNHKMLLERAESIGHIGYWEYDVNSDRVWASNGARLIYGFDKGELSLNNIQKIVFPEFRTILNQKLENLIHENDKYDVEFKIYRQNDGAIKHIRSHAEFSKTENKVHGIIQDISLQKKTELELIEARYRAEESDRLKSAFVSNMSHEIRTPMNGIVGYAHLLAEKELDIDTRLEYKENIHKCCNQLIDKVNDILDIAKIESGQIVVNTGGVELNKLLNDVLGCFMQQVEVKKLELILNTENVKNELTILTDEVKLRKIIINLIDNAVRFTQSGYIEFGYRVKDAEIEFYVKDTGLGIDPSHYEIIFQPFCQANSQISTE
ncbi:MAG TPA: histidine kinase dimerization/phospho-acceptor domain-containing protein, partial [Bacteroidales bacterium]|nr:histidine kinase dimerization/phospho-acceptor domain-containing protein [Bacteroidales bacterium]